jgi:hypothetical protein
MNSIKLFYKDLEGKNSLAMHLSFKSFQRACGEGGLRENLLWVKYEAKLFKLF